MGSLRYGLGCRQCCCLFLVFLLAFSVLEGQGWPYQAQREGEQLGSASPSSLVKVGPAPWVHDIPACQVGLCCPLVGLSSGQQGPVSQGTTLTRLWEWRKAPSKPNMLCSCFWHPPKSGPNILSPPLLRELGCLSKAFALGLCSLP